MDSQSVFAQLRDVLAELYPDVESARRVGDDAGISLGQIHFNTGAINFWHAILVEALRTGKSDSLLNNVLAEYGAHRRLSAAYNAYVVAGKRLIPPPPPGTSKDEQRAYGNRQAMLKLVHDIWVKGVLEHSLYNQLLIDLDMEQRPEAVERPWGMVLETPAQASRLLPAGTKMVTVFAERNQSLLILGDPGSGKSTMLLELARDLLAQAEQNPALPMPVLFNLFSWAEKRQPLRQWLVDELREKYHIPKSLAQAWVEHDELLLLLDGLDEVKQAYREECIKALNEFQQSGKTLVPLALCSRMAEYAALTSKLKLNGAIVLRPLTPQQIDVFLLRAGDKLSTVTHLLQHDAELQTLAQSPLTFSILCLTYQAKPEADIQPVAGTRTRLQQLFDAYIRRMFQRPGKLAVDRYPRTQTLHWLAWLAARMEQSAQTEFLIERLQPDWLQSTRHGRFPGYLIMLMWGPLYGLLFGSFFGLIVGLIFGLGSRPGELRDELLGWLIVSLIGWSITGSIVGVLFGLIIGSIDWVSGGVKRIRSSEQVSELWNRLKSSLYTGLFWGLLGGLLVGPGFGLGGALLGGLLLGLLSGLVGGFKQVSPIGRVPRSWKQRKSNMISGMVFGLIVGLIVGLIRGLIRGLFGGLSFRLLGELLVWPLFGLIFGLFFEPATTSASLHQMVVTQTPNQGSKLAAKFSVVVGLLGALIFGLGIGLSFQLGGEPIFGPVEGPMIGLMMGLTWGLIGGLIGNLVGGGDIVAKHLVLRFALYRRHYAPLNYARFLDYCTECIFLRKVGGGYIFIHRLLLEHFASLTEEDIQRLGKGS